MYKIPKWINTELPTVPEICQLSKWLGRIDAIDTVRPNLSTRIHFASGQATKTDIAYLYLHGYSSCINEISPVTEMLAEKSKANIVFQRIARHGIALAPMEYLSPQAWYYSALMGLAVANKIGKKVVIISCSTGSTLSLLLSARNTARKEIAKQILISPNCWPHPKFTCWLFTLPIIRNILENAPLIPIIGPNKNQDIRTRHVVALARTEIQEQNYTLRVPTFAIGRMMQLVTLIWKLNKFASKLYAVPTGIVLSSLDKEVVYNKTIQFFRRYHATHTIVHYNKSSHHKHHVIAGDICSPNSTEDIVKLIFTMLSDVVTLG